MVVVMVVDGRKEKRARGERRWILPHFARAVEFFSLTRTVILLGMKKGKERKPPSPRERRTG
jgi:hypothetical protein